LIWKLWPEPKPAPVQPAPLQPALKANGAACASNTECRSQSCVESVCRAVNAALRRTATQSSTHGGGDASRAVDGNTDGDWTHNSVTHTESTPSAWWQVDLGAVTNIDHVVVYNRTDCCPERLTNFDVLVSDDGTIWRNAASGLSSPRPALSTPVNASARFLRVQLRGTDYLSLAEVEVIAR
jgi:hypothetical protein